MKKITTIAFTEESYIEIKNIESVLANELYVELSKVKNIFTSFEDLRSSLFQSFPHLADIDMCLSGEKLPEKIERRDIKQHVFKSSLNNFWLSNSITRSSKLMCERNNISKKIKAGD